MPAVDVRDLSHAFGEQVALREVDFRVEEGELFGVIGPDGAGKTTLFRVLTTLLVPQRGSAEVLGRDTVADFRQLRREIGYMPGEFSLYADLTVRENLDFFATIFGTTVEENYGLVEEIYVQLEPFARRRAGKLSGGMKQKLALCCALIHAPGILFLDEPTTGVDAVSRVEFWDMLGRLRERGITIVVSTPYMDEASRCQRVGLMQGGRLLRVDTPEGVRAGYGHPLYRVTARERYRLLQLLRGRRDTLRADPFGEHVHLTTEHPISPPALADLGDELREAGLTDVEAVPADPTIEDVFLDLLAREDAPEPVG